MRVSNKRDYLSCSQSPQKTNDAKRQRTQSPARSLFASTQSPVDDDSRDDGDALFLFNCDADVAESLLPRDLFIEDDSEMASFILSLAESREDSLLHQNGESEQGTPQTTIPFTVKSAIRPSLSSSIRRACHRVRFAPEVVTVVIEIPSRRSLTAEEKRSLYRGKRELHADAEKAYVEIKFEGYPNRFKNYRFENALDEDSFFRNRLGELVHPAHWAAFVSDIVPSLAFDFSVPPGFSSFNEYVNHLFAYERLYDTAVQRNVFRPSNP